MITVMGIDPSLRNTGIAIVEVDGENNVITKIVDLILVRTEPSKNKSQRRSSSDFHAAVQISESIRHLLRDHPVEVVFAEIPSGTQSARASFALGITLGLVASVRPTPIEVTPNETKVHSVGIRTATKGEMIEWATTKYPKAPWQRRKNGDLLGCNEHLADAIGVVTAGLVTPQWNIIAPLINLQSTVTTD